MKIYVISLQEIRSRDQSDKPPTVVKCQDEMLALYYCWMFQHLGTIEQGFYYSSPRDIFYTQKHWRFTTVGCFYLQVQQNKGSSSPRHIFLHIETVTIQIRLIGGLLLLAVSTFRPLRVNRTWVLVHLDILFYVPRGINSQQQKSVNVSRCRKVCLGEVEPLFYCTQRQKQPTIHSKTSMFLKMQKNISR